ncbi:uncharacterized protein FIBRA_02107 [Fibroporia radiculosa]|uniref:DUF6593 domain-containing protein n=1 Tax=Fibroporia radiculosa TaxID=599839 RepID=J4GME7_9APHY|nr:uncharacterized protein FIBRA_02107 [Fibroporia radiculosa]CCM00080.1 predicted protein [Fibroporia radiculosa]
MTVSAPSPGTAESITTLTLNPDNPCNATISATDGLVLYVAHTDTGKNASTTRIFNADDVVIASLQWKDTGFSASDKVTLGERAPVSIGSWLSKSMVPFKDDVSFKDDTGRRYKWKGNSPGRSLELYTADDNFRQTIARFHKSYIDRKVDPPALVPAKLLLLPRANEIRDIVVSSFLFLERSRRTGEISIVNRADAIALASRGAAVMPALR